MVLAGQPRERAPPIPSNPLTTFQRGLVPAMKISSAALGGEHILIESSIIVQFLADLLPGRQLEPASNTPAGAMARARLNFFVDTWNTKVGSFMFSLFKAQTAAERESFSRDWVAAVRREIEPLLADAAPYFGGSQRLTLAEVGPSLPSSLCFLNVVGQRGAVHHAHLRARRGRHPTRERVRRAVQAAQLQPLGGRRAAGAERAVHLERGQVHAAQQGEARADEGHEGGEPWEEGLGWSL
jgi:glutathione S-transferase